MIAYINGQLHLLTTEQAIVLAGGVGYAVNIPLSTYYKLEGTREAQLYIHTHVREDALALYGFHSLDEKSAFERLISISGIGPRLAQVILSGIDVRDLAEAIAKNDARRLSSIPGVGKKTSERICLELRDKLLLSDIAMTPAPTSGPRSSIDDDVVSALVNLGYKGVTAENAVKSAHQQVGEGGEFSALLKAALRHLTK